MSLPRYQHTQVGSLLRALAVLVLAALLLAWRYGDLAAQFVAQYGFRPLTEPLSAIVVVLIAAVLWNFSSLTVEVTRDHLRWWFGLGLPSKQVALREIAAVAVTRTPWWSGRGIRRTRQGWLYTVAGHDAVQLQLAGGRTVLIGSDEPARLVAALSHARPSAGSAAVSTPPR